uniref:uncharacterized protein LOC100895108 isoform X3 n=1 Tax=Callithrix jacchus TaxID=9483 RepID=UPI00159DFF81|nr:uncharacterized protein LOC100895108 isoform X3 [Callithrix jacchus]
MPSEDRQSAILGCGAVLQQPSWAGFLPAVSGSKERLAFPSRYIWYLGWCYGIEILLLWKSHACRFNRRCQLGYFAFPTSFFPWRRSLYPALPPAETSSAFTILKFPTTIKLVQMAGVFTQ